MEPIVKILANELGQKEEYIQNVITLLDEGNTIPFIARYRKEMHGGMDDTSLRALNDRLTYLRNLAARREEVLRAIEAQEKMTDELRQAIENAATLAEVEDLYRPYKQKRRTRATMAKEKGLEPLADLLYTQSRGLPDIQELAKDYISEERGVMSAEEALASASDIIAENISDSAEIRKHLKELILQRGKITAHNTKEEDSVYRLYYNFTQNISKLQGHQVLALNRGERE